MSGIGYYYTESNDMELILAKREARVYPWHMHMRHWAMGVVRFGNVLLLTADNSRRVHAGEHFLIPPYELHSLCIEPESLLCVLCFDNMDVLANGFPYSGEFLQAEDKVLLEAAISACRENFSLHNARHSPSIERDSLLCRSVQAIIQLIEEDPGETLHLEQMAEHGGYSLWHFLRGFQKVTGMTPHAFQLLCRLRLLRSMLRTDTASSIAAVSAGFSDQSHMHKVFKRQHGITPKQFKQVSFKLAPL